MFPHLLDDAGAWTERRDVWYKGVVTATANKWLSVGCGSGGGTIGPELQFGHIMGYYHDEPVTPATAMETTIGRTPTPTRTSRSGTPASSTTTGRGMVKMAEGN